MLEIIVFTHFVVFVFLEQLQSCPDLDAETKPAEIESDEEEFPYELVDDDSDLSRQELGPRWTGERRVSFPSPDKLAVYQEPEDDDFSLSKNIFLNTYLR